MIACPCCCNIGPGAGHHPPWRHPEQSETDVIARQITPAAKWLAALKSAINVETGRSRRMTDDLHFDRLGGTVRVKAFEPTSIDRSVCLPYLGRFSNPRLSSLFRFTYGLTASKPVEACCKPLQSRAVMPELTNNYGNRDAITVVSAWVLMWHFSMAAGNMIVVPAVKVIESASVRKIA